MRAKLKIIYRRTVRFSSSSSHTNVAIQTINVLPSAIEMIWFKRDNPSFIFYMSSETFPHIFRSGARFYTAFVCITAQRTRELLCVLNSWMRVARRVIWHDSRWTAAEERVRFVREFPPQTHRIEWFMEIIYSFGDLSSAVCSNRCRQNIDDLSILFVLFMCYCCDAMYRAYKYLYMFRYNMNELPQDEHKVP